MKQQSEKQKINKPSDLLSLEENDQVFSLLGRPCKTMCTGVVQLFITEAPAHSSWNKKCTGIACFIRDSSKRSYFIRIYCLLKNELVWEEEMYDSIYLNKSKEFLIDFEGKDCMVAINFASENEAKTFYKIATMTIENRNKRRATNKRRSRRTPPPTPSTITPTNDVAFTKATTPINNMSQVSQSTVAPSMLQFGAKERKRTNRKFTKADISMPTDFKHLMHVGWNAQKGFDWNGEEVDNLNKFLEKAGVSDQQLNDRDTRAFIYDFIKSNNVLDSVKSEQNDYGTTEQQAPPPVPSRHHNGSQRSAPPPPPPPTRQPPPPVPKTTPPRNPPGRPPPITVSNNIPAPPPAPPMPPPMPNNVPVAPPPPPAFDSADSKPAPLPVVNDARSALMDSIRKGTTLKKVPDPATLSTGSGGGDSRSDLLSEIRQGVELRPAANRELGAQRDENGTDALADALRRALQERGRVLRSSDEESDDSDEGEWDD